MEDRPRTPVALRLRHSSPAQIVPFHSQRNACDLQKRKFEREIWLVLPLLSRGTAHIVHPSATSIWIVWQVLGWQQSQKCLQKLLQVSIDTVCPLQGISTGHMCIFCFQNSCMWIFWHCGVQLAMCVSTICQARKLGYLSQKFFRGCQPGHFFRQSCGTPFASDFPTGANVHIVLQISCTRSAQTSKCILGMRLVIWLSTIWQDKYSA